MYDLLPMEIASSGMAAQRVRMGIIASNMANAQSTRSADGSGPYQRRMVVLQTQATPNFQEMLQQQIPQEKGMLTLENEAPKMLVEEHLRGVSVARIDKDSSLRKVYDPSHEDADAQGYVNYPDISVVQEMTDMIAAERCYSANLAAMKNTRDMLVQTLELLK